MPERRSTKRISARLKVWCEGEDFTLLAETGNVSAGGLFVRTSSPTPSSRQFRVTIEELAVIAQVQVVWTRGSRDAGRGGMGLQILGFEQGMLQYQQFLDTHRSGEHSAAGSLPRMPGDAGSDPDSEN